MSSSGSSPLAFARLLAFAAAAALLGLLVAGAPKGGKSDGEIETRNT